MKMSFFLVQFRGFKNLLTSLFLILSIYSALIEYQKNLCYEPLSSTNACISIQITTEFWLTFLRSICDGTYPFNLGFYAQKLHL